MNKRFYCTVNGEVFPRIWLYVKGHVEKHINKALEIPDIGVILNLEDGVPNEKKEAGREIVINVLQKLKEKGFGMNRIAVRINAPFSYFTNKSAFPGLIDLKQIPDLNPGFLLLPKISKLAQLKKIDKLTEKSNSKYLLIIENSLAAKNMKKLINHPRVFGAVPGIQDFLVDHIYNKQKFADFQKRADNLKRELRENLLKLGKFACAPAFFILDTDRAAGVAYTDFQNGSTGKTSIHPGMLDAYKNVLEGYKPDTTQGDEYACYYSEYEKISLLNSALADLKNNVRYGMDRKTGITYGPPVVEGVVWGFLNDIQDGNINDSEGAKELMMRVFRSNLLRPNLKTVLSELRDNVL